MKFTTITAVFLSTHLTTAAAIAPAVYVKNQEEEQVADAKETHNLVQAEGILNTARSWSVGNVRRLRFRGPRKVSAAMRLVACDGGIYNNHEKGLTEFRAF
ncbi:hypothetical protein CORC01_07561 [Colletotrichum orchidophilum]|uniref:Uncharacterized protein n=1 Tax=Colletotrichum orchidophilum TaxID=1209926 RepID=A0A1G4B6P8_9PEZI|nr:uncharacterized protein CORC01_07561 [Colletotrichum orchidophilum]OHE97120.1 hypothetical protein CORC01_07561 [Colletotrichum orchidophilum]